MVQHIILGVIILLIMGGVIYLCSKKFGHHIIGKDLRTGRVNCKEFPSGDGYCDMCDYGRPDLCRYISTPGTLREIDRWRDLKECDELLIRKLKASLVKYKEHCGQCVDCKRWTCGYCGIHNSKGEWRCEKCHHG